MGPNPVNEVYVRVSSDDVLSVKPDQTSIIQQCCECGLTHEIRILDPHAGMRLQFVNLGHSPDLERFDISTDVLSSSHHD